MSRLVLSQITIKKERSISSTKWYYLLQPANAAAPDASNYGNPPPTYSETGYSGWSLTEPIYTVGDDRKLYQMSLVIYTDDTYEYSTPTLSSSYEASKAAYNEIIQAEADIEELENLGLKKGYFWTNPTYQAASGGIPEYPVGSYIASGINNTITQKNSNTYGLNTWVSTGGIKLRYNAINLAEFNTSNLNFYYPSTSSQQNIAISLGITGAKNSLIFYNFSGNKGMELDTSALTFYNPGSNNAQLIIGANGTLQSGNYSRGSNSKFANDGTKIDLINGDIITKYFRISQGLENGLTPGAYIYGTIEALDGTIGTDSTNYWEIGNSTDYNLHDTAKIIGHGSSYIQLGDSSTWRLATNRIHTGWYTINDTLLHYPAISSKYWDFGIHTPTSLTDKFLYIRSSKASTSASNVLQNLLYDINDTYDTPQWDYKFWIDGEGKVHAPGFYIGNSTIPIGGGAGTIAEKLLTGAGSSTRPVYFRSDSEIVDGETIDHTGEVAVVSWDVKTTLINSNDEVPTSAAVKTFVENKGYLTSYTETDPTVPTWAKQSTKPTYSYSEINGTVPQSALPSYVDDVLEIANYASLPNPGESGKIYITIDDNKTYRWGGTNYVEISSSLALGENSSTAYRGDRGAAAYAHAVTNKGSKFASGFYKITTNSEGHVTAATAVAKSDITGLGIPSENTDTKVNVSTRGTNKAYLLSTTSQPTSTKTAREAVAETGVYLETSNSVTRLIAPTFVGNLTGTASGNLTSNSSLAWGKVTGTPTTLSGYGIDDAKIDNGVITLGNNTITPFTGVAITNLTVDTDSTDNKTYLYVTKSNSNTPTKLSLEDISIVQAQGATTLVDSSGAALDVNGPVKFVSGKPETMRPNTSSGTFLRDDGTWATPGGTYSLPIAKYNILGGVKPWFSTTGASTLASGSANAYSSNPSINARTTTAGKYYAVEIDKNGRLFVNVPWSDTTYTIPTQTNSSTTGVTINDHSTTTIYGVSSSTTSVTGVSGSTSVRGVKTDSTTTASKASGANGSASSWTFASKTVTKNPSFTYNSSDTSLTISFGTETIYSKSGGSNGTAPTWSFTDVTVPIMANSNTTVPIAATNATTVPIKNSSSTTVVTSKTHTVNDPGHSHTI